MPKRKTNNDQPAPRKRGAPFGNLNALKTGRSSRQLERFAGHLVNDPEFARLFKTFLGTRALREAVTIRGGEAYLRKKRRSKERELRRLMRAYEWIPSYEPGEAPWEPSR